MDNPSNDNDSSKTNPNAQDLNQQSANRPVAKALSKIKTVHETITKNTKSLLYQWYIRDFNITKIQVVDMIIRGLIVSAAMTFWITTTIDGLPHMEFEYDLQYSILIVGGFAMLLGGIITDYFVRMKYIYELFAILATIPMNLMLFLDGPVVIVATYIMGILSAFLLILFFTSILNQTNLLNRGRMFTLVLIIMSIFTGPIISLIILVENHYWVFAIIIGLSICSMILRNKRYESINEPMRAQFLVKMGFREYWRTLGEAGVWPYFFFLSFSATTLGFYTSSALSSSLGTNEIVTLVITGILSLPLVCGILDNVGRKPAGYIVLFLIGIFAIFFDYPSISPTAIIELRIGVYMLTAFLIVLITAVVPGDLSSGISRGRVTGVFLFATVFGTVVGSTIRLVYFSEVDFENMDTVIRIADWTTLLIFLAMFIFSKSRDPFQEETPDWREYLNNLFVITVNGLSLYNYKFQNLSVPQTLTGSDKDKDNRDISKDNQDISEDLVSGGIIGIQGMLKEISHSEKNIEVVNHGDLQILFHYGQFSTAVLFVRKDLIVLREKLAYFHNSFEERNKKHLAEFNGDITALVGLAELTDKYFK